MTNQNSFQSWLDLCILNQNRKHPTNNTQSSTTGGVKDEISSRLRQEARLHFRTLSSSLSSPSPSPSPSSSPEIATTKSSSSNSSSTSTVAQDLSNASSSTPNGALALLVSTLRPAYSSTSSATNNDAKVRALYCLSGALEGSTNLTHGVRQGVGHFMLDLCRLKSHTNGDESYDDDEDDDDDDVDMIDYVDGENFTPEEVTQKLQAMDQAHEERKKKKSSSAKRSRRDSESRSLFTHDDVRDAAITGLNALLRSRLEMFPTQQKSPKAESSPLTDAIGVVYQSMTLRVELAMSGVRLRCQSSNADADETNSSNNGDNNGMLWGNAGDGYETTNPDWNIEDGLSQLPRLKRSLCFTLLEGAMDGLKEDGLELEKLLSAQLLQSKQPNETVVPSSSSAQDAAPPSLLKLMSEFVSLASSCMHGETDPRCLLQILRLLNKIQQVMSPLFAPSGNGLSSVSAADQMELDATEGEVVIATFPSIEIFDAVAPYYPVQFTPPKNDPHGITRDMLQSALMAVLCERGALYKSSSNPLVIREKQHDDGGEEEKETMIMLAARMFLERLEPPKSSDYDPPSNGAESDVDDKLNAVRDLSYLLLLPPRSSSSSSQWKFSSNVARVTPAFFSELSSSMARVHEEAVSSDEKSLASAIRKFSSSLARTLEPVTAAIVNRVESREVDTTLLWEAYVVDILRHLSPTLGSSPQGMHGRASTAYLASLAADGGLMTLKKVLEGCYPRFLGVLSLLDRNDGNVAADNNASKQKTRDEEKMTAAMRGIAALVSSCRVALQSWQGDNPGVQVHPHPLSHYLSSTIQKITVILKEDEDGNGPLSMAAIAALESVLTSADMSCLEEEDLVSLGKSFSFISRVVLGEEEETVYDKSDNLDEWKTACARVIGAVIALGLCQEKEDDDALTESCKRMKTLATSLLPEILASATSPPKDSSKSNSIRYEWAVLAGACANGTSRVSQKIVSELISGIIAALRSSQADQGAPAMVLAYLVRRGGPNVALAFHGMSPPEPTPFDIINEMCKPLQLGSSEEKMDSEGNMVGRQLQVGMSLLQLPASRAKDEEVANDAIKRANSILPFLVPAYERSSAASSCGGLAQFVDQILPPLSEWDEVKLCIAFPLLAAVLNSLNESWGTLDSATLKILRSMITDLAQFSISSDHDAHARSAAASCLFSVLYHSGQDDDCDEDVSNFRKLLEDVVHPVLTNAISRLKEEVNDAATSRASSSLLQTPETLRSSFSQVEDIISFLGLLGSAAACKGGPLSQTADKVASFLIELSCTGASQFPFTEATLELVTPSDQGRKHPLLDPASHAYILPASAFGGIISVQNGGPFWRQRMTHKTLPILSNALQLQAKSQNPPSLGTLAVVCHMICCLPGSILGKSNIQQILPTMVAGLVYFSKNFKALAQSEMISSKPTDVLSIILAALTKILTISPEYVTKFIGVIIPSLLLLSSSTESSGMYIPKQLLVFQCLETIAKHTQARNSILREKDQVVAVLSALVDHPSMIIRNAVVQVRNVWYILA